MSLYSILDTTLTDIADAIRSKTGKTASMTPAEMVDEIESISGGASSWTKVAETSYQVSTTSTSAVTVATWATGHSEIWTNEKILYIRIKDTEGKKSGCFFQSHNFYINTNKPGTSGNMYYGIRCSVTVSGSVCVANNSGGSANGIGVYTGTVSSNGNINIMARATSSVLVNSTYKVEVYLLDPAGGVPIFE